MLNITKELYNISFRNKKIRFDNGEKINRKIIKSNNNQIENFLEFWTDYDEVESNLLPDINLALASGGAEVESDSQSLFITMTDVQVDFYDSSSFLISIPTADFKEITEAWLEFLKSTPYDGQSL